jgi:hypothetical protein
LLIELDDEEPELPGGVVLVAPLGDVSEDPGAADEPVELGVLAGLLESVLVERVELESVELLLEFGVVVASGERPTRAFCDCTLGDCVVEPPDASPVLPVPPALPVPPVPWA